MFRFATKSSASSVKHTDSTTSRSRYAASWRPALRRLKEGLFSRGGAANSVQPVSPDVSEDPSITTYLDRFDRSCYRPLEDQRATLRPSTTRQKQNETVSKFSEQSDSDEQPEIVDGIELLSQSAKAAPGKNNRRKTVHDSSMLHPLRYNPAGAHVKESPAESSIRARPSSYAQATSETDEFSIALRKKLHRTSLAQAEKLAGPEAAYIPTHAASDFQRTTSVQERKRRTVPKKREDPFVSAVDETSEDFQNFIRTCHLQHLVEQRDLRQTRMSLPIVKAPNILTTTPHSVKGLQSFEKFLRNSHIHYLTQEDRGWCPSIGELDETEADRIVKNAPPPNCFSSPKEQGLSVKFRRSAMSPRPASVAGSIVGKVGGYIKPTITVNSRPVRNSMIFRKTRDVETASIDSYIRPSRVKRWSMAAAGY
ncbi:hypothetical protein HYALB_00011872 [Hymenoscyphus albidus]|uniref:Uncharacterized protein n=1 Tax=Hymenoscyphus albidus TaxID=595503 RepID=A0A9N9LNE5_9HELO|nr:hypothetical protein HYALB_00011872 [Hymenoscyphus albidus]